MAGLFGVLGLRRDGRHTAVALNSALDRLARALGDDPQAREQRWVDSGLAIAIARRGRPHLDAPQWPMQVGGRRLFVAGHPVLGPDGGAPEGFFAALTLSSDGAVALETDRCGTRRLFYAVIDGRLCFAPQARALAALMDRPPRLDITAAGMLLSSGVLYRGQTLLEGVRRLGGGARIIVHDGGLKHEERFRYEPGVAARAKTDCGALAEEFARRVVAAVGRHLGDVDTTALFLSGRADSRIILAGLLATPGVPPARVSTVTWGDQPGRPDSDLAVAARLADGLGVQRRSLLRRDDDFAAKFEAFNALTGGASVMAADHPDEPRLMAELAAEGFRHAFRGDQIFLQRPGAYTLEQAWQGIGLRRLRGARQVLALLAPKVRDAAVAATEATFEALEDRYAGYRPGQAKEMLYFDIRLQGYLFDAAQARMLYLDERNILLDDPLLALAREMPDAMRAKAAVFTAAAARLTAAWPPVEFARTRNLAPWAAKCASDQPAGAYGRALLEGHDSPVWDFLDRAAVARLIDAASRNAPRPAYGSGRALLSLLRRVEPRLGASVAAVARRDHFAEAELLKRVMVLTSACNTLLG